MSPKMVTIPGLDMSQFAHIWGMAAADGQDADEGYNGRPEERESCIKSSLLKCCGSV